MLPLISMPLVTFTDLANLLASGSGLVGDTQVSRRLPRCRLCFRMKAVEVTGMKGHPRTL